MQVSFSEIQAQLIHQSRMNINRTLQLGVIIPLPILVLESVRYVMRQDWLESLWIAIIIMVFCVGIYLVYVYTEKMVLAPFKIRFLNTWISIAISLLIIVSFRIFIHNVLDTDYRIYVTERIMTRLENKLLEIEKKQKIEIDRSDTDEEKKKLMNSFTTSSLVKGIPLGLLFSGVLALLAAALARPYY